MDVKKIEPTGDGKGILVEFSDGSVTLIYDDERGCQTFTRTSCAVQEYHRRNQAAPDRKYPPPYGTKRQVGDD